MRLITSTALSKRKDATHAIQDTQAACVVCVRHARNRALRPTQGHEQSRTVHFKVIISRKPGWLPAVSSGLHCVKPEIHGPTLSHLNRPQLTTQFAVAVANHRALSSDEMRSDEVR